MVAGLVLLLIGAQQGAVVHELGHIAGHTPHLSNAAASLEPACALCPSFAQAATPAFSHSFVLPRLLRTYTEREIEAPIGAASAAAPTPRSRGPPSLS
jgi:hypothetical protein